MKILELPTDAGKGLDLTAFEAALSRHPVKACLFASCFSNPLGAALSEADKRRVLAILAEKGVPLIEDDVYGDLHFTGNRPKPYMALGGEADVIYCASLSKTLAPGYRIGWVVSHRHIHQLVELKLAMTLSGVTLAQMAVADYLSRGGYDQHLRRLRRIFSGNITKMSQAIAHYFPDGTRISRPQGGFVLWVEMPEGYRGRDLFADALKRGICISPGDVFSAADRFENCIRISCGHRWGDHIAGAVKALGGLIQR